MGTVVADSTRPDATTTRLELATRRGGEIARRWLEGTPGGNVQIVAFASEATLLGSPITDPRRVAEAVAALAVRDEPARLAAGIELASAISRHGEEERGPEVVLLSDGVLDASGEIVLASAFTFEPIDAVAAAPNAGIVAFAAERDPLDRSRIVLFARIGWSGETPTSLPVTLWADGTPVANRIVDLPAAGTRGPNANLGEATLELAIDRPEATLLELRLPLTDPLAADNSAFAAVAAARPLRVAIVTAFETPDPFLLQALEALEPAALPRLDPTRWASELARLDPAPDLLIFEGTAPAAAPAIPTLTFAAAPAWLARVAADQTDDAAAPAPRNPQAVLRWNRGDPLLRDADPANLLAADSLLLEALASRDVLVEGTRGPLLLRRSIDGVAHVAAAFRPGETNWPVQAGFVVFIANAIDELVRGGLAGEAVIVRSGTPFELRCAEGADAITIVAADGRVASRLSCTGRVLATVPGLPSVGAYRVQGAAWPGGTAAPSGEIALGVSLLDARQSDNRPTATLTIDLDSPAIARAEIPRTLWPWVLAAALVLVAAEWLAYLRAASRQG
jgi:hypothetical protein